MSKWGFHTFSLNHSQLCEGSFVHKYEENKNNLFISFSENNFYWSLGHLQILEHCAYWHDKLFRLKIDRNSKKVWELKSSLFPLFSNRSYTKNIDYSLHFQQSLTPLHLILLYNYVIPSLLLFLFAVQILRHLAGNWFAVSMSCNTGWDPFSRLSLCLSGTWKCKIKTIFFC